MKPEKVNLAEKFSRFDDTWRPRIVAALNGQHVKLAKLEGEFVWHRHEREDELFLVVQGELMLRFRDGDVTLAPGEFIVVPHGVEHLPVAREQVQVLLVEPESTVNTGSVRNERTAEHLDWI